MKDVFYLSGLIIKEKLGVLTDLEKADLKRLRLKHSFSQDVKVEDLINRVTSYSEINKVKAWATIEANSRKARQKPKLVFKLFNRRWYEYATAAVLTGVIITAYFFRDDSLFNKVIDDVDSQTIVNINTIEPGTDKAILTLGDGSQIALEKGESLKTQNASSNGEEIIYKANQRNTKELVYNYLTIPRGGQFHIILSDGTKVWLNSESQLKYPVNFIDGETRQVELVYGEAYFDVSPSSENKGAKFKVKNALQEVEVLGTEFNIKAYKDETNIYTTLVEGKVTIDYKGEKRYLKSTEQSNLDIVKKSVTIRKVDVKSEISWKDGIFSFRDRQLKDIMKVISRWYDVDVAFENKELESVEFIGILDKRQSIEEILSIMKSTSINNYEIKDHVIILK